VETSAQQVVAAVVIGRNEGERLRVALSSLPPGVAAVYVDSGSSDGSPALARSLGTHVLELEPTQPFTAARARNTGLQGVLERYPAVRYVQFIDGDCELAEGWLSQAAEYLEREPACAIATGHLREKAPAFSVYNALCDMEWEGDVGEIAACGGIFLGRVKALVAAGGFREDLIAGEEPELCVRLRAAGWKIRRLDVLMAAHDAAMTHFSQWWRRAERAGHAAAEGAFLHGRPPERHGVRQVRSALFWGLGLPIVIVFSVWQLGAAALLLVGLYPLQVAKIARRGSRGWRENILYGLFLMIAKFPEVLGNLRFQWRRLTGRVPRLIEYK
jgi:GT2 family glycosyltransferase